MNTFSRYMITVIVASIVAAVVTVFVMGGSQGRGATAILKRGVEGEAVRHLPLVTESMDPVLGIPARVNRPNNRFLKPFSPTWAGSVVRYTGPPFSRNAQKIIWIPDLVDGKHLLRWQTTDNGSPGLQGIFLGNELELLDNNLYDFGVGALFVKVRSRAANVTGYALLETIIGETKPRSLGIHSRWRRMPNGIERQLPSISMVSPPMH
ncbi:MAG TPA: hypothetical protein PK999_03200 [Nitrospira sp.]|nr:hypothetical protein [Nitrospira sp.]